MRASLAVKPLHKVNDQHLFRSPLWWLSFFLTLFSRYAPCFAISLLLSWLTTRSPITVNGSPLQEGATLRTFLWEEEAPLPILCGIRDADAESVTRRLTMGGAERQSGHQPISFNPSNPLQDVSGRLRLMTGFRVNTQFTKLLLTYLKIQKYKIVIYNL